MTVVSHRLPGVRRAVNGRTPLKALLDREAVFSWLLMALPLLFLASLVGYPLVYGLLLSLQDRPVAQTGTFVGFQNFVVNFHDPVFWQVAINTFVYTGVATFLKMVGGLCLAVAMNQHFRMKNRKRCSRPTSTAAQACFA
jgi:multiple sugar transport system permease protein